MRIASLSLLVALAGCGGAEAPTFSAEERAALPSLVYESDASGTRGAYRLDLATGESTRLSGPDQDEVPLAVSPDGTGLVIGRAVGEGEHALEQLVLLDGDSLRTLTPPTRRARNPAWSEDGRWITFESDLASTSDLFRIARDGGEVERLTDNPEGNYEPHAAPGGQSTGLPSRRCWKLPIISHRRRRHSMRCHIGGTTPRNRPTAPVSVSRRHPRLPP